MTLTMTKRQGVVVWLYSLRQVKQLRRYGLVYYTSKRMKYVYLYIDMDQAERAVEKLRKLHYVKRVSLSQRPNLDMDFGARVGKPEKMMTQKTVSKELD